jgi:hypothetical protein
VSYIDTSNPGVLAEGSEGVDLAAWSHALQSELGLSGVLTAGNARIGCGDPAAARTVDIVEQLVLGELGAQLPLFADIATDSKRRQLREGLELL